MDRLYIKRKNRCTGLIRIQDCVECERRTLKEYLANSGEDLLKHVAQDMGAEDVIGKKEFERKREGKIF